MLLAVLIKSPGEREISGYHQNDLEIERLPELLPTTYIDGPFLKFLQINFEKGLELIIRLVDLLLVL